MPGKTALVRDSFVGQLVYFASGRRIFRHQEELPDFVVPEQYTRPPQSEPYSDRRQSADGATLVAVEDEERQQPSRIGERLPPPVDEHSDETRLAPPSVIGEEASREPSLGSDHTDSTVRNGHPPADSLAPNGKTATSSGNNIDLEKRQLQAEEQQLEQAENSNIVDWYGSDDPECPMNWSFRKKCFVTTMICLLTFSIYIGSAIYSPGTLLVATEFGVSDVAATLGLTLFVAGYGIGPMILSPLSEIPQLGRTSVYIVCLIIFVALQAPTATANSLGQLLPLRFFAGFVGSPPLATGGASLADMWAPEDRAVAIGVWGLFAVCGPVLGPLLGGFAAQANGWRWTIWILLWLSGGTFLLLLFFLPETSSQTILYRRAVRLRRLTGNQQLKSEGEIVGESMTLGEIAQMTMVRPFVLGFREPIVLAWNLYIALAYGILYIYIESFAIVFIEKHGFNLGENGLAFLGLFVGAVLTYAALVPYFIYVLKPKFKNGAENFAPEERLPPAMVGAFALPICLFWFGWTSGANIPWIVPIIGSSLFGVGVFLLFMAGLNYLQDCYPRYVASVLAGNDFFRSMVGAAFPLFSNAFFRNVGVGPACSILGGISILMIPIPFVLYRYGAKIRSLSKFADS